MLPKEEHEKMVLSINDPKKHPEKVALICHVLFDALKEIGERINMLNLDPNMENDPEKDGLHADLCGDVDRLMLYYFRFAGSTINSLQDLFLRSNPHVIHEPQPSPVVIPPV